MTYHGGIRDYERRRSMTSSRIPLDAIIEPAFRWFGRHRRALPWRDLEALDLDTRAYRVLVSEVMLQQTQVPRVIIIFKRFLTEFPSFTDLAKAGNADVIRAWRGMGYNSRALRLRDAARMICDVHGGHCPSGMEELMALPGVGHYTAAAIRNFAFDCPTACIDTNIRRILHRVFHGPEKRDGTWRVADAALMKIAASFVEHRPSAAWPALLMDLGSSVCTKRSPSCAVCPLRPVCKSADNVPQLKKAKNASTRAEPGSIIGGRFVPNRIIRGRIVDYLRDARQPQGEDSIGLQVRGDWSVEHNAWLRAILKKLEEDMLIERRARGFILKA